LTSLDQQTLATNADIPGPSKNTFRKPFSAMTIVLIAGICVMALKFYAYLITGSSAILSDALESIINVVAGAFALLSLWISSKPPDNSHPYGHGKIEYFSAGFEGALIMLASFGIFWKGLDQLLNPHELPRLTEGLLFVIGVSLVNLALAMVLIRLGKQHDSLVLSADGRHIMSDVYSSAGVVAGLALVNLTGWIFLDGLVAFLVGINILVIGYKLVRESFSGLMNTSDPILLEEICNLLSCHRKDVWIDVHKLRAWRSGRRVHVDFHLILPRDLPLALSHQEVVELEKLFELHFQGQADLLIHLDPCNNPECPVCKQDPCEIRSQVTTSQKMWTRDSLTC
jgi:cation diffusion facilitator family transporter